MVYGIPNDIAPSRRAGHSERSEESRYMTLMNYKRLNTSQREERLHDAAATCRPGNSQLEIGRGAPLNIKETGVV